MKQILFLGEVGFRGSSGCGGGGQIWLGIILCSGYI